jgi:hypothetical protein
MLVLYDRRVLGLWLGLSVVVVLNLLAAIPPTPAIGSVLPVWGPLGTIGAVAMTTFAIAAIALTSTSSGDADR